MSTFNIFRRQSDDKSEPNGIKFEFGPRGEDLICHLGNKVLYVGFNGDDGYRIYPDDIKKWEDGSKLTESEKEKVFIGLLNTVIIKAGKPIVIINIDDPSKALWEGLCSTNKSIIEKIEFTSDEEHFQLIRKDCLDIIQSGSNLRIDGTKITNEQELDRALAIDIKKKRDERNN